MNPQHINTAADHLQGVLPFGNQGITSADEYQQAQALAKTTTNNNPLLHRVLTVAIADYEAANDDQHQQLADARKAMDRFCDTPSTSVSFNRFEVVAMATLATVAMILTKTFLF